MKWLAYRPVATEAEAKLLDTVERAGSVRAAARELGVQESSIRSRLNALAARAAVRGLVPEFDLTHPVAEGHLLKGVSTLYDRDGKVAAQWVKTRANNETDLMRAFVDGLAEKSRGGSSQCFRPVCPMPA